MRRREPERGWALLTVLLACAIFVIMAAKVVPQAAFETRRQREQDLMYRGNNYKRGIQLFYRKFRKYPVRLEELENTNQIRFIRKRWVDPMTKSDEWRLIHVNAQGLVIDSALVSAGSTTQPGQPGAQQQGNTTGLPTSIGAATSIGDTISSTTSGFSNQPTVMGAGIAGVASKSEKPSILVYNSRQKYNEWEFVYNPRTDPLMIQQGLQQQGAQPGVQPGQPGAQPGGQPGTLPGGNLPGGPFPGGTGPRTPINPQNPSNPVNPTGPGIRP